MKTFIRWSGNKSKYLKYIHPHIPTTFNTYIEPFIGSGAVFLYVKPDKWIINDLNKDLIHVWKSIKTSQDEIINLIKKIKKQFEPLSKPNKAAYCKDILHDLPTMPYNILRATTYIVVKYCAYMGNIFIKGKYYFPGLDLSLHADRPIYFLSEKFFANLQQVHNHLRSTKGQIFNKDYKYILNKAVKGDFVFLDPPYIEDNNYQFNYNKNEILDDKFISDLSIELKVLDKRGVKWLMTQADNDVIRKTFKKYKIIPFPICRGYTNTNKNELIIKNY